MKRKLHYTFILALCGLSLTAQFNQNAPWMKELKKSSKTNKNTDRPVYSIDEISEAFEDYWLDKDKNAKGSGYKPFKRWESYWTNFADSKGYLPTARELWNTWENKSRSLGPVNPVSNWSSIGPFATGVLSGSLPGQGRINAIKLDPNNSNIWYAGAPAGGIWKSTDAGLNWTNLFDDFPQIGVSGIAIDPNNSDIIYIATGDDDAADSFSAGVFKSLDGGTTWNQTGLNPSNQTQFDVLNEIVVDPNDSNTIWVAGTQGLQRSIDGGTTWEVRQSGNITDFILKPGDSNTIYAVSGDTGATLNSAATTEFYKSTDGGDTFNQIIDILPTNEGRMVLGVSEANPDVVYILVAGKFNNSSPYRGLFKSVDSGESFTETANTTNVFESSQAWFDLAMVVSPTDENEIYTGVLNLWKSTDGGDSFNKLNNWNVNDVAYTHADIHTLKFFGNQLFCGSDGGLYMSENGGDTFTNFSDGLVVSQFYRISIGKNDSSRIVGGTQDNAGFVFNNNNWNVYTGGDGMDYEIDPTNSNIAYGFTQNGGFLFITNNLGETVSTVSAPRGDSGNLNGNWITPLAVDGEGEVYSAYDKVYKLVNNTWVENSGLIGSGNIDDLEIDQNNPMIMYAANGDGLFRSEDAGVTFELIDSFGTQISDIAINGNNSNIVYLTTSARVGTSQAGQPGGRSVFKVEVDGNNLVSSENITFDLPTDQAFFSIVHQGRNTTNPIYVGTSLGVYRLDDTITEWEDYFTNFPSVAVGDIEIDLNNELIIASTYGRGVWQSAIPIETPDNDIALTALSPNEGLINCGEIIPELTVENNGLNVINQIDIVYSVNNGANQNFTFNGTINSGETSTIQLPAIVLTEKSVIEFNATTTITNDAYSDNNTRSVTILPSEIANGGAVFDFETPESALITYNADDDGSVWERGVATGVLLNTEDSGNQVYGTTLNGNHPDATRGFILSGCYELSSITAPVLKFDMAYDLENNFDVVYVEYTTDNGENWNVLGQLGSQPNWYNSDRTNASSGADDDCQNCPGAQWLGTNATMTEYAYDFNANAALGETDLTGESNVIFRIVFHSDPAVNQEGAIIDNFQVEGFQDDEDDDNDGILDVDDNCPLIGNANQLDTDSDGEGDVCDTDDDNDGILDSNDICPLIENPGQEDFDNDGIGDVCDDDIDNDGVPNAFDTCNSTPPNSTVNVDGCAIFSLPSNNFSVSAIGESCISSDNGSINIVAQTSLDYTATLTGNGSSSSADFNTETSFTGLASGTYEVCFTVAGQADYLRCVEVAIEQPEDLSVTSKVNSLNNEITLSLSGAESYIITLNNERFTTTQSSITLPLTKVENSLSVKTEKDCQGIYEERVVLTSDIFVYPNPIYDGELNIFLGSLDINDVETSIFNISGKQVFRKKYNANNGNVRLNISGLADGIYLLNLKANNTLLNYKIIKK
ncbi:thrombospondin type 3 repeat-containing protein [Croceitalea marina]|uniref:Thrombospondin type 3 repeat-containing protein n=1 Tax=Croceitalea marina TaxID=1775166 RepID=A0ABW5N104_9FLAO